MNDPLAAYTLAEIREALEAAARLAERQSRAGEDEFLEWREAAMYLKMSPAVFKRRSAAGEIPRCAQGAKYVYYRPEIREWQLSQRERERAEKLTAIDGN